MKILQVIPSVAVSDGGPARAIRDIERALAIRGLEVTTITTNYGIAANASVPLRGRVTEEAATRWYFQLTSRAYKFSSELGQWLVQRVGEFDVVHAHGLFSHAPVCAARAAQRAGVPYVLRPLGVLARYGLQQRRPLMKRVSLALLERRLLEAAAAVHFTSDRERSEAEDLGFSLRGVVIPLGVDVGSTSLDTDGEPKGLLFLSRIDPVKNLDGLLRALAIVVKLRPDVALRIAGEGDPGFVQGLKRLAEELGLARHVTWLGQVDGPRKAAAFAHSSIFIQPSHSESFGIATVEALGAGLPCVLSRGVAIQPSVVAAGAGVAAGTDPESLAEAILGLLADEGLRMKMSKAAVRLARAEYSLDTMGARLESLYRSLAPSVRA